MSMSFRVTGTLRIVPPLPVASLWEFIDTQAFATAERGLEGGDLAAFVQAREKVLVPATDATRDAEGRPSHIAAAVFDWEAQSPAIGSCLRQLAQLILSVRHDFEAVLAFQGDDGSEGDIAFFTDGDLEWVESYAPGRMPETFG